jgi:hypothetical protein
MRAESSERLARYFDAVAILGSEGSEGFRRALAARPVGTSEIGPGMGGLDDRTARAIGIGIADPLSPDAHRVAADSLSAIGIPVLEAIELYVAVRLDTTRAADALRLGRRLAGSLPDAALKAFAYAAAGASPEIAAAARAEAAALRESRVP